MIFQRRASADRYTPAADPAIMRVLALACVLSLTLLQGLPATAQERSNETLRARVEALAIEPVIDGLPVAEAAFLTRFYERREFAPAWDSETRLAALLEALDGSRRHGLNPEDYHLEHLARTLRTPQTALERANLDILATDALARYAFHLRFGKVNPEELEPSWNFSRSLAGVNPTDAVERLIRSPDLDAALDALAPQEPRYRELIDALRSHRALREDGGWPMVPPGETLRSATASPRVGLLRERLAASGDLPAGTSARGEEPDDFDDALDAGVRAFQERHGLEPDGVAGARTLAALNVPVEARIDQLRVNLERLRWIFRDLEARYVITNIARFRTTLVEDGDAVWSTRSVVGRPYRQTPVFRSRMTYLVFNPTWTVPPGILRSDLLPEIRRDLSTLERRNMVVLDTGGRPVEPASVDWSGVRGFPYMIRQEPGPDNALGRVKFMFPNPYHVYMHDTPSRELFERAERSFSSGCIRLERPLELAERLLAETGQWSAAAIERALAEGQPRTVTLTRPLTVLLVYATAVPEDGRALFLPDLYDRDARLLEALDGEFSFSPPAGYDEALQGLGI